MTTRHAYGYRLDASGAPCCDAGCAERRASGECQSTAGAPPHYCKPALLDFWRHADHAHKGALAIMSAILERARLDDCRLSASDMVRHRNGATLSRDPSGAYYIARRSPR